MARPKKTQSEEKKTQETPKKVVLEPRKSYIFISNGVAKSMPKGVRYEVTTEMAQILLDKGYGNVEA